MQRFGLHAGKLNNLGWFQEIDPRIKVFQISFGSTVRWYPPSRQFESIDKSREWIEREGFIIFAHAPYLISLKNHFDKSTECLKRHLDLCDRSGIRGLVVHSGNWGIDFDEPVDKWTEFLEQFQDFQTHVLLENMTYGHAMNGDQLNAVCRRVPKCGVCLDTVHAFTGIAFLKNLATPFVKLVHLNQTLDERNSKRDRHSGVHLLSENSKIGEDRLRSIIASYPNAYFVSEFYLKTKEDVVTEISHAERIFG